MNITIIKVLENIKIKMEIRRDAMANEIARYRGQPENYNLLTYFSGMQQELVMQINEIESAIENQNEPTNCHCEECSRSMSEADKFSDLCNECFLRG